MRVPTAAQLCHICMVRRSHVRSKANTQWIGPCWFLIRLLAMSCLASLKLAWLSLHYIAVTTFTLRARRMSTTSFIRLYKLSNFQNWKIGSKFYVSSFQFISLCRAHQLRHRSVAMPLYRLLSGLIEGYRQEELCGRHTAATFSGRQSHMHQALQSNRSCYKNWRVMQFIIISLLLCSSCLHYMIYPARSSEKGLSLHFHAYMMKCW